MPTYAMPSDSPTDPGSQPATPAGNPNTPNTPGLMARLQGLFPWMKDIGLTPEFFQNLAATSTSPDEMLAQVRQAPQYRQRFQGLFRADGTIRMNEAEYVNREKDYRNLLTQNGYGPEYTKPQALIGFFENEIDPNELRQRLDTYQNIKTSSTATRDAFYVYAGMDKTVDDLFEAVVDPAKGQALADEYNAKVAAKPLDYGTFIARATALGMQKVSQRLEELQKSGALTSQAVQSVTNIDPKFAQSMVDVLYHGGDPVNGKTLSLSELMHTFEYAAIGGAATSAGLTMPDLARVQQLRAAGVDRARATAAYTQYGGQQGIYAGATERMGVTGFDRSRFEDATLLGNAATTSMLQQAMGQELAAGHDQGGFGFQQDARGQFTQKGLSDPTR